MVEDWNRYYSPHKGKNRTVYYYYDSTAKFRGYAIEKSDDLIQYDKVQPEHRIDLFDASVFACIRMLEAGKRREAARKWWGV